jgi:iron complex outermembrane recepter protein
MFPCPCSLRSTQCAALIALASAAHAVRADAGSGDGGNGAQLESAIKLSTFIVADTRLTAANITVLKFPTPLRETPRSVDVISAARIQEQDFQRLEDTFRYVPGVFSRSQDGDSYHFVARGFDMGPDETHVDGFSGLVANGTFSPSLFGVEQVVYLRGPAGLLYGAAAAPGGMINLITKKPQARAFTEIEVRSSVYAGHGIAFGHHPSLSAMFDTNGRATANGHLLYRVTGEVENERSYKDGILDRERGLLATFTWKFGADQRFALTPLLEYQRQPFGAGRGLSFSPSTSLATNDQRTGPINTSDITPLHLNYSAGTRTLSNEIAGFDFDARLTSRWRTTLAYRFIRADSDSNQFAPQTTTLRQLVPSDPSSWVVDRRQSVSQTDRRNHAFDLQTTYETTLGPRIKNLTQLGFNGRYFATTASRAAATQPNQSPVKIYSGKAVTPLTDRQPVLVDAFLNRDFYWNTYLQNQTSFHDRWVLTVGLGYGEQHYGRIYPVGQTPPANLAQLVATRKGDVTPNAALVYKPTNALTLYGSYSTSYSPAPGDDEDNAGRTGTFGPTTGVNYEVGAKADVTKAASVTISAFQTELDNVLTQSDTTDLNPRGNRYYTQTGDGRHVRGVEFGGQAHPLPGWNINATASFLDARYRGEGKLPGARVERTPRWAFSLYQNFKFTRTLPGLAANLGLIWQDARWSAARTSSAPDPLILPAYFRIDAGLSYHFRSHWDVALNCENVADTTYFVNGTTGANLEVGGPRRVSLRVGRRW